MDLSPDHASSDRRADPLASLPVYLVSLPGAEARRQNMRERLAAARLPFRFVDAIDGRTGKLPDVFDSARVVRRPFRSEPGLACTLTHRHVHRAIAQGEAEVALVLEDDAALAPHFRDVVADALAPDFDVFKLEGLNLAKRRVAVGRIGERDVVVTVFPSSGTAAYLIRRAAARRFCALPVIHQVPDIAFADPRLGLRLLELDPFCAWQDQQTGSQLDANLNPDYVPQKARSLRRLVQSFRRKIAIAANYGPGVLARLELQRAGKLRARAARLLGWRAARRRRAPSRRPRHK